MAEDTVGTKTTHIEVVMENARFYINQSFLNWK